MRTTKKGVKQLRKHIDFTVTAHPPKAKLANLSYIPSATSVQVQHKLYKDAEVTE